MKKIYCTLAAACLGLIGTNAMAVDVDFTPRAGIGFMAYDLEWTQSIGWDIEANDTVFLANVGGTLSMDRFYFDAYFQQTAEGEDDFFGGNPSDFDVMDYSFALGYNVLDNMSVYVGWKGRETEIEMSWSGGHNDATFESQGFFLGAAYGFIFEPGTLSVNAAYVRLDGEGTQDQNDRGVIKVFKSDDTTSDGVTLGLAWKGDITENWSYGLSADWFKYSFDEFTYTGTVNGMPWDLSWYVSDVEEEAYTLRGSVYYYF